MTMRELLQLFPAKPGDGIDWGALLKSPLGPYLHAMERTPQNPRWHAEGDVLTHTRMVCEALIGFQKWREMGDRQRQALFIAALLHDVGKPACTRMEDGQWTSPNHTAVGAKTARTLLWREFGLCGTPMAQQFRETVCALIRYHSIPMHILHQRSPALRALRMAADGELCGDFSLAMLACLAEADIRGRMNEDIQEQLESVALFEAVAEEAGCLRVPLPFPSPFSRYACLSGRNVAPGQPLYDDTWGQVLMLCGLPGTGKDTWLREACPDLPMVSLDDIRRAMRVAPEKPQSAVVHAAQEQAKAYLRKKQPFVWNATNLTPMMRSKQTTLFERYGASVKIVYLETAWDEQLYRNENRPHAVPARTLEKMLDMTVPPTLCEAQEVVWKCLMPADARR